MGLISGRFSTYDLDSSRSLWIAMQRVPRLTL